MIAPRMRERGGPARVGLGLALAALIGLSGCGEKSPSRVAARVLEKYRKTSGAKPLPASGMILERLSGGAGASGRGEILWSPGQYRETVSSAGMTAVHGIESGRAYFIDGDGVTRVVSDPVLRELRTRSYFWRRAWLFSDHERARLGLGPSDAGAVRLDLTPEGGNLLSLTFSRSDGRLLSARSPRFSLEFESPARWRDVSDPEAIVQGETTWVGLPTGAVPGAFVGGGRARFEKREAIPAERGSGLLLVSATLSGRPIRLAVDGAEDGPVAVSPALASSLGVAFTPDVFGRAIAPGATLTVAGVTWPAIWIRRAEAVPPGADAVAGGCLFREAIVDLDAPAGRLRLENPESFSPPDGFFRTPIDDDGDWPVAILHRGKSDLRLTLAADSGEAPLLLASESAARMGLSGTSASGLAWGPILLPDLPFAKSASGFYPHWGDDGRLGLPLLSRFHAIVNMPQRWIYLRPDER